MKALDYIPHATPMVFVDDIVAVGDEWIETTLNITPDLMFATVEGLPTWASIEIMAQTISAYAGLQGQKSDRAPRVGFLLGTRKLHLPMPYFDLGTTLKIRAERQYIHEGLGQFLCEIEYQQHHISALLSVYEPEQ